MEPRMIEDEACGPDTENEPDDDSGARATLSEGRAGYSNRLFKRRRLRGEVPTRLYAIQNQCRECVGFNSGGLGSIAENVRQCPATECWLWPWRNGNEDPAARER